MTLFGQSSGRESSGAQAIAAALDWWREAGVDQDYADEAASWLASPRGEPEPAAPAPSAPTAPSPPAPARQPIGGERENWPRTLADFAAWWLAEPSLDDGQCLGRVPPRGVAGADLMVLVDHPEAEDTERLLSGSLGRLLDAVLTALGTDTVYFAAALPRHMPMPDWQGLAEAGLGEVLRHHIALASPRRLLIMGGHISSLLGHDPAKMTGLLTKMAQQGGDVPLLAMPGLAALQGRPRGKARLWQALLDWQAA